jgi:hypothetical protein
VIRVTGKVLSLQQKPDSYPNTARRVEILKMRLRQATLG